MQSINLFIFYLLNNKVRQGWLFLHGMNYWAWQQSYRGRQRPVNSPHPLGLIYRASLKGLGKTWRAHQDTFKQIAASLWQHAAHLLMGSLGVISNMVNKWRCADYIYYISEVKDQLWKAATTCSLTHYLKKKSLFCGAFAFHCFIFFSLCLRFRRGEC